MKGRCRTCKNWKRNAEKNDNTHYGICFCDLFFNGCYKYRPDWSLYGFAVFDDFIDYAEIATGELFGCIHHTPLPEGVTK